MQPPSQPPHSPRRPRRRMHHDHAPHRPQHYEPVHRPRRVTRAHEQQWDRGREEAQEAGEPVATPRTPRRPSTGARLLKRLRLRRVRFGPWEWAGLGASTIACILLLCAMAAPRGDYHMLRNSVAQKEAQFSVLEKQKREDEKKLAYLQSEKGREQILAQRGYLQPGDRILLFPVEEHVEGDTAPNATENP